MKIAWPGFVRRPGVLRDTLALGSLSALFYLLVVLTGLAQAPVLAKAANALSDMSQRYAAAGGYRGLPMQVVLVDDRSWRGLVAQAGGRIPAALPATTLAQIVEVARGHHVPMLVLDIDIAVTRPAAEEQRLRQSLDAWARDPDAGALLLVRRGACATSGCVSGVSPYDAPIAAARNILWVSAVVERDGGDMLRWVHVRQHASTDDWQNIAVTAAIIWKAFAGSPAPARTAAARVAQLKACLAGGRDLRACSGNAIPAARERLPIPFYAGMPTIDAVENVQSDWISGNAVSRSAADFTGAPLLDDLSGAPVFVGISHNMGGDRFLTPLGRQNGVFVVAGAASEWAHGGFPPPASLLLGVAIAFAWGCGVGAAVGGAAALRKRRVWRNRPILSWVAHKILDPIFAFPAVILIANILFFLLLSTLPYSLVDWSAVSLSALLLSLVTGLQAIHATIRESLP